MKDIYCTTAEATAELKRQPNGTKFCLSVRCPAPTVDEAGNPTGRYFEDGCAHYLPLSKREAVELVSKMLSKTLEDRGGRIHLHTSEFTTCGKTTVTYWIG